MKQVKIVFDGKEYWLLWCNESVFSPRPKAVSRKLSSAWPEAIVIGSQVATHVLSATICLSQDAECFSRKKPGTDQSSGLGD